MVLAFLVTNPEVYKHLLTNQVKKWGYKRSDMEIITILILELMWCNIVSPRLSYILEKSSIILVARNDLYQKT